ncbi:FHA domain-containing protein [Chthonobacter rhizosphaerae]|uniref:FHA domain-containing protein n=1 Tax=Chthonobacter rhizosphaerae TaxID=2735553 RepID=UPI0015EF2805|nr:FHA domain-containing protein [Chthonobacter rhizosphaerae]
MADAADDNTVLKILTGQQSGAEVQLGAGDYTLGSGLDDDIQLVDVSLMAGHVRLRLGGGRIQVAGGAGTARTATGAVIEAGADYQDIEPLDIVTAGAIRFALGRPSARWSTIADDDPASRETVRAGNGDRGSAPAPAKGAGGRVMFAAGAMSAAIVALGAYGVFAGTSVLEPPAIERSDFEAVRAAVGALPFAERIRVTAEADGRVFVSGYVDEAAERRAVIQAITATGAPVRPQVWIVASLDAEIRSFIEAARLPVAFELDRAGLVTLTGTVLDKRRVDSLMDRLRENVVGLSGVASRVKTAEDFLVEVKDLAARAQVAGAVLFRLDGQLIEATGAIPAERVDAWVGFLQSYSRRFSDEIALRSFVTLQSVEAAAPGQPQLRPVLVGSPEMTRSGDIPLDPAKLDQGGMAAEDVFAAPAGGRDAPGAGPDAGSPKSAAADPLSPDGGEAADAKETVLAPGQVVAAPLDRAADAANEPVSIAEAPGEPAPPTAAPLPDVTGGTSSSLETSARFTLEQWRAGRLGGAMAEAIDSMARARSVGPDELARTYLGLFLDPRRPGTTSESCRPAGLLTLSNLPAVLFWLDLISLSTSVSLASFDLAQQQIILEAALSPVSTRACERRLTGEAGPSRSAYLEEAARNPAFVSYVTRRLPAYPLPVSGAHLAGVRYVQTPVGRRYAEGAAPSVDSRVSVIGELGMAIQKPSGFEAVIFDETLAWRAGP